MVDIGTIHVPVVVRGGGGIDFTSWTFGDNSLLDYPGFSEVRGKVLKEVSDTLMGVMLEERVMFFELSDTMLEVSFCLSGDCLDGELSWEVPLELVSSLLSEHIQELKDEVASLRKELEHYARAQGEK